MGRGVVRLVLSLFLAPKTSPATWENLCSAEACRGLGEIFEVLKKRADSGLCVCSSRRREGGDRPNLGRSARVSGLCTRLPGISGTVRAHAREKDGINTLESAGWRRGYSGKLRFSAPSGSPAEKCVRGGGARQLWKSNFSLTAGPTLIFARAHGGDFANECRCFNVETRKIITAFHC